MVPMMEQSQPIVSAPSQRGSALEASVPAGAAPGPDTACLLALAAAGSRIAGAQSLAEWEARLTEELLAQFPGAQVAIVLAQAPAALSGGGDDAPLRAPLWVGETYLGQVLVQLPSAVAEESRARLQVLAQMAAPRLVSLAGDARPGHDGAGLDLLQQVQRLGRVLADPLDLPRLYTEVMRVAAEVTGADNATLLLGSTLDGELILQAAWGLPAGPGLGAVVSWGVADRVIADGMPLRIEHAPSDPRYTPPPFAPLGKSLAGVPLYQAGRVIGALTVLSTSHYAAFSPAHVEVLAILAHYVSAGRAVAELLAGHQEQIQQLSYLVTAVQKTRDYLQALVTGSGEAIITLDLTGVVLSWNPAATRLLGYPAVAALGRPLGALIAVPGATQLDALLARVRRAETVTEFELPLRRADGVLVESEITLSPVGDLDGQVLGVSLIGRDISARRAAEREIRRHNHDLHLVNQVTTMVNQALDAPAVLSQAVQIICAGGSVAAAALLAHEPDGGVTLVGGVHAGPPRQIHYAPGAGPLPLLAAAWERVAAESASDLSPAVVAALLAELGVDAVAFGHPLALPVQAAPGLPALLILGCRRPWDPAPESRLLFETVAWQIGLGLHKAQLYAQVSRTARVQSELYEISRRIQATPGVEAVLPEILEMLVDLVAAEGGTVVLTPYPGATAAPPAFPAVFWGTPPPAGDGARLILAMRRGAQDLGRIVLWRSAARSPFDDDDQAVAGAVADHLALALENRSLLARDLAVLYEAPLPDSAPLELERLVGRLLAQAQALAGVAGGAALLYDPATDDWAVAALLGEWPAGELPPAAQQRPLLDQVRRRREPLLPAQVPGASGPALLALPLLAGDHVVGAFLLPGNGAGPAARRALASKLPFLIALAGRAGVLIDNMQLQLRAETLLILEERQRIAREMHDGLAQSLTQIRNHCELIGRLIQQDPERALRELTGVRADLKRSAGEVVRVIHALRPLALDELDLSAALQKLAEEFTTPGRLQVDVRLPDGTVSLPPQIELILYRMAQEALNHVAHRAGATACRMALAVAGQRVVFSLEDNGESYDPQGHPLAGANDPRHGLHQLYQRITAAGGTLEVTRAPGAGTHLVVTIPCEPAHIIVDNRGEGVI